MDRKPRDHPRKTTVKPRKTSVNSRIAGPCYKSLRLNGDDFSPQLHGHAMNLELLQVPVNSMSNASQGLTANSTDGTRQNIHKALVESNFGDVANGSMGGNVTTKYNPAAQGSENSCRDKTARDPFSAPRMRV